MAPVRVVFILGFGHSGSTLLDLLLDGHSQIAGVGEMERARPEAVCTCGKHPMECPVWHGVFGAPPWPRREVYRTKLAFFFDRRPFLSGSTHKPIDEKEFLDSTVAAYRTVLEREGKQIIVDSSAQTDRADLLSRSKEVEPYYIHLIRDGRGATWSFLRKYKRLFPFFFMWFTANVKIELFFRRARGKHIRMRYEDLTRDPAGELARICALLDIPYEAKMLEFRQNEHHQIEGNRMRFGIDPIRTDEKWRTEMPLSLRALFNLLFGWMNVYYRNTQ